MADLPKDTIFHYHSDDGITIKVDAIPLVRCHECCYWDRGTIRWNGKQNEAICDMFHERGIPQDIWTVEDYYCANGEPNQMSENVRICPLLSAIEIYSE